MRSRTHSGADMQSDYTVAAEQTTPLAIDERQAQEMYYIVTGYGRISRRATQAERSIPSSSEDARGRPGTTHAGAPGPASRLAQHVVQSVGRTCLPHLALARTLRFMAQGLVEFPQAYHGILTIHLLQPLSCLPPKPLRPIKLPLMPCRLLSA